MINIRSVIVSWDFAAAAASAAAVWFFTPQWILNTTAQDLFRVGTSVLSLLFSVFFAALAVIVSTANEEFLAWLESGSQSEGQSDYQKVVGAYRLSLMALFLALIITLWFFGYTTIRIGNGIRYQHGYFLVIFVFFFFYGLFVAVQTSFYAVRFSEFRNEFAVLKRRQKNPG